MNILAKNLLILASAGSGKTFQLGNRVIGLVARGVAPEKVVALTFTRKAAGEFADSVFMKLAAAAGDEDTASELRRDLVIPDADFGESLEKVVRSLPRFTLGTMDSFFSKVVRGFQYELGLTGGRFDLLEGTRAAAAKDEILVAILGESIVDQGREDFLHAFRRASIGKEGQKVINDLRGFVKIWQTHYRTKSGLEWAPASLAGVSLDDWEARKHELAANVSGGLDGIEYTRKGQREALEKVIETLAEHTIGSGSLGGATSLLESVMDASAAGNGPLAVKFYKDFIIGGPAGNALSDMVVLAARCEMAAALIRTRAVREVVSVHDAKCEKQLRRRGLLGFDDVKILMGEWATGEDARLRREAVDFRLDARYEHWLLDEFQDTSRADWLGLLPLIDEAAGDGDGSVFIVGDRKQAIYGWRGGEVRLFDEVAERYRGGLEIEEMAESWRSCPEVLSLVNLVCQDRSTMYELFGEVAGRWDCPEHFSAKTLLDNARRGEARVEVVEGKWEERLERLGELLSELGIGRRPLTCGILVRSNSLVREIADDLRAKGFDVIEEGRREPSKDNPVGVVLWHLLKWLADPSDSFANEVVRMSPLSKGLHARFGEYWQQVWEGLSGLAAELGFAGMIGQVIEDLWEGWSDFGRRRAGDLIAALGALEASGSVSPREAAEWIERLEVSQIPGMAAVQVMTIHKAKGLGFDIVILPEIPNDGIPSAQNFDVAEGDGWISETPPKWARDLIPEMREAEVLWEAEQRYEAFCNLYVALTRSKRGLYVLLESPSANQAADKPSLANWIGRSVGVDGRSGIIYQSGRMDWVDEIAISPRTRLDVTPPVLAVGVPRRGRGTPSGRGKRNEEHLTSSAGAMRFGCEVHAVFEKVGWIDEETPELPDGEVGCLVGAVLNDTLLRMHFERRGRQIECLLEQPVEAVVDGVWLSGVIDRLHIFRDPLGKVERVEVIDFKTDGTINMDELVHKYRGQMHAYREVLLRAYPFAKIESILLSTTCREVAVV